LSPEREQPQISDTDLVRATARGDEKSFAALYDRYGSILFGLLLRILHSRPEAEDVLQEVFLQVWQRAADFDDTRGRPFTWLVTLARSRAIDRLRANESRSRTATTAALEVPVEEATDGDAIDEVLRSEQGEIVRRALSELPVEQRRALILAYFEGLTQSEIAARLGEPLGTIKTRTRAGLIKLRDLLWQKMPNAHQSS